MRETKEAGITLVALVITIILLLILAAVSMNMLLAENGLFGRANEAKKLYKIEGYREQLELMRPELQVDKVLEKQTTKEVMDKYEEKIKQSDTFNPKTAGCMVERQTDEKIKVVTKEKYVFIVTEKGVEYIGKQGETPPPDLQDGDITFEVIPSNWTNGAVTVEISTKIEGYRLQYSLNGRRWMDYTETIGIEDNQDIYVRLSNELEEVGGAATITIANIDRLQPKPFTAQIIGSSSSTIEVKGEAEDEEATQIDGKSGTDKYYFSKDNGTTWLPERGQTNGSYTFEKLTQNTVYNIKIKAVDKAGNETITEMVSKNTGEVIGLDSSNVTFNYSPSGWTNGSVKVGISTSIVGYQLQYSLDGNSWSNYESDITVTDNNTEIYARLYDGTNSGSYATGEVSNIDRLSPKTFTPSGTPTTTTIILNGTTTDAEATGTNGSSGISKYYFSKDNGASWLPAEGQTGTSYTFRGLSQNTTYLLKVKAVDKAGNEIISNTATVKTYIEYILTTTELKKGKTKGTVKYTTGNQNSSAGISITGAAPNKPINGKDQALSNLYRWYRTINLTPYNKLRFYVRKGANHGMYKVYIGNTKIIDEGYGSLGISWKKIELNISGYTGNQVVSFVGGYDDRTGSASSNTQFCDIRFSDT